MNFFYSVIIEAWRLLQESAVYILFGIMIAGLMRVFINPATVARHLGRGRFTSVIKASILGIPIPLCSCGVLPAATSLKKQGANNGATTAFMISTPESGIDSVALTYALLDPVMTVARPIAAFTTATVAGIAENIPGWKQVKVSTVPDKSCPVDNCCDGVDCPPEVHRGHHPFSEKIKAGLSYAYFELWNDIAVWFLLGLLLAGLITVLIPAELMTRHLGGGLGAMLIMLAVGIPLYICATASTPIAAALILKGVSPGAALVFLLAGPATNITSLTVLLGILGKRATAVYLLAIAVMSVLAGLILDQVYGLLGISARAVAGQAAEVIPYWVQFAGALAVLALSIRPLYMVLKSRFRKTGALSESPACDCSTESCQCSEEILPESSCCSSQACNS